MCVCVLVGAWRIQFYVRSRWNAEGVQRGRGLDKNVGAREMDESEMQAVQYSRRMYPAICSRRHVQQERSDDCLLAAVHNISTYMNFDVPPSTTLKHLQIRIKGKAQVNRGHQVKLFLEKLKVATLGPKLRTTIINKGPDSKRNFVPVLPPGTYLAICQTRTQQKHSVVLHIPEDGHGILHDGVLPCAVQLDPVYLHWIKYWCTIQQVLIAFPLIATHAHTADWPRTLYRYSNYRYIVMTTLHIHRRAALHRDDQHTTCLPTHIKLDAAATHTICCCCHTNGWTICCIFTYTHSNCLLWLRRCNYCLERNVVTNNHPT